MWRTRRASRRDVAIVGLLGLIALVYTTPWDNYLVYREVWMYGTGRVMGTIGYVPVEEYLFFLLQPIMAGLWFLLAMRRSEGLDPALPAKPVRRTGAVVGVLITIAGAACLFYESSLYMGLILVWSGPVVAGQWFLAGERFLDRGVLLGIAVPTGYLWLADGFAIGRGIWSIAERYTVGLNVLGLPLEEAVFFLMTNVLVVQGIVMFRPMGAVAGTAEAVTASARPRLAD